MRSLFENKRLVLVFSVLALGALTALATGLSNVPFRGAQSFGREEEARALGAVPQNLINSMVDIPLWQQISLWLLILIMIVLISALLSPELRKRLILIIIRVGITYWAFYIVFKRYREILQGMGLSLPQQQAGGAADALPPPEFVPPQTISLASYLVSFGLAVLLVLLAWKLFNLWKENSAANASLSLNKIAGIARSSLNDLSAGRESTDVIMNCYFRMSDVVENKRNFSRNSSMTPAEFATRLEQGGLPAEAVQRLTRLFERVRYGGYRSGSPDVNEAVACLTTILHHCGETV